MKKLLLIGLSLVLIQLVFAQSEQDLMELLKTNLQAGKKSIVIENMGFTSVESEKFWPVYEVYDKEALKLSQRQFNLIKKYADHFEDLSDKVLDEMVEENLQIKSDRIKLSKDYYNKFKDVLPVKKAAKFYQVMNQIQTLIDFQVSMQIPLIETHLKQQIEEVPKRGN